MMHVYTDDKGENKIYEFSKEIGFKKFSVLDSMDQPASFRVNQPYLIDGLLLCFIETGVSNMRINFKEYVTAQNTILTIHPNSIIEVLAPDQNRRVRALFIPPDILDRLQILMDNEIYFILSRLPFLRVNEKEMSALLDFHEFIGKQQQDVDDEYIYEINIYLTHALFIKLKSMYKKPHLEEEGLLRTKQETVADNFFKLLFENHIEEREVSFYADRLCVSPKHLSSVVKKAWGKPISYWIAKIVIDNAKCQLKTTDMSISEIADIMNFASPSLFGRFFKRHTGMTPLEYRMN